MSGFTYSTLSSVIPLYNLLIDHVEDTIENDLDENNENEDDDGNDNENEDEVENENNDNNNNNNKWKKLKNAAKKCRKKLLEYYNKTNDSYLIATILDPRLKLEYYRDYKWEEELINNIQNKLVYF